MYSEYNKERMFMMNELLNESRSAISMTGGLSPSVISNVAKRSAIAVRVLMLFIERVESDNSLEILQSDICFALNISQKSAVTCIAILEEEGCIVKKRKGIFNRYYIVN